MKFIPHDVKSNVRTSFKIITQSSPTTIALDPELLSIWNSLESKNPKLLNTNSQYFVDIEGYDKFFTRLSASSYEDLPLDSVIQAYIKSYTYHLKHNPIFIRTLNICALCFPDSSIFTTCTCCLVKDIIGELKSQLEDAERVNVEIVYLLIQSLTIFVCHCESNNEQSVTDTALNIYNELNTTLTFMIENLNLQRVIESPASKELEWMYEDNVWVSILGRYEHLIYIGCVKELPLVPLRFVCLVYLYKVLKSFRVITLDVEEKSVLDIITEVVKRNATRGLIAPKDTLNECIISLKILNELLKNKTNIIPKDVRFNTFISECISIGVNTQTIAIKNQGIIIIFNQFKRLRITLKKSFNLLDNAIYNSYETYNTKQNAEELFPFVAEYFCNHDTHIDLIEKLLRSHSTFNINLLPIKQLLSKIIEYYKMNEREAELSMKSFLHELDEVTCKGDLKQLEFIAHMMAVLMQSDFNFIDRFIRHKGIEVVKETLLKSKSKKSIPIFIKFFDGFIMRTLKLLKNKIWNNDTDDIYLPNELIKFMRGTNDQGIIKEFYAVVLDYLIYFLDPLSCTKKVLTSHQIEIYSASEWKLLPLKDFAEQETTALKFLSFLKHLIHKNLILKKDLKQDLLDKRNEFAQKFNEFLFNDYGEGKLMLLYEMAFEIEYGVHEKLYIRNPLFFQYFILLLDKPNKDSLIIQYLGSIVANMEKSYTNYQHLHSVFL